MRYIDGPGLVLTLSVRSAAPIAGAKSSAGQTGSTRGKQHRKQIRVESTISFIEPYSLEERDPIALEFVPLRCER